MKLSQVLKALNSKDFYPNEIIPDGKIHRFKRDSDDRGTRAWYLCYENISDSNEQFYVCVFGDWKFPEDESKFITQFVESKKDRSKINEQLKRTRLKLEQEKQLVYEKTSQECTEIWPTLSQVIESKYLKLKGILKLYGAKTKRTEYGTKLYIPVMDLAGKIWGYQTISDGSQKFFFPGTKKRGNFYVISSGLSIKQSDVCYICEGFATGATIHQASGKPTVVAFDSGNILPVAKIIKANRENIQIIICGDDDKTNKDNPGRKFATEAAKKVLGTAVFPNPVNGSDFNDLFLEQGIDVVKKILLTKKPDPKYILALGYDGPSYFFVSNINPQIQTISSNSLSTTTGLQRLQPLEYWEAIHPKERGGVDTVLASDYLMQKCHKRGVFHLNKIRGRGCWNDQGVIVYHLGDRLYYNRQYHELHQNSLNSKFIYQKESRLPNIHENPLSLKECKKILEVIKNLKWKTPDSALMLAGWIVLAPLGGLLPWRPHVWLTGSSGSGKSYLMDRLINKLLDPMCYYFQGQTTEAGIRQSTGSSTLPVLFDEFEPNDEKTTNRVQTVLELARQSSSDSDAIVSKGTQTGQATQYKPKFAMLCSSIRTHLEFESDRNRFTVLELLRHGNDRVEHFDLIEKIIDEISKDYGSRLFSRIIGMTDVLLENIATFGRELSIKYNMRFGQQYGALLGACACIFYDEPVSKKEAKKFVKGMNFSGAEDIISESDEGNCLDYLIAFIIRLDIHYLDMYGKEINPKETVELSIAELINAAQSGKHSHSAINRIGLKIDNEYLYIANKNPVLKNKIFTKSRWGSNWKDALSRIVGAKKIGTKRFGQTTCRATAVPISNILVCNSIP